jgi:3-dehydroquinate synthase
MVLNLGHTVGHAVELESHYGLNHGEAVAIGMRFEAEIAYDLGMLDAVSLQRIIHILEAHGLPVLPPNHMDLSNVLRALSVDKKHQSTHWTFVLPREIGQVEIVSDV